MGLDMYAHAVKEEVIGDAQVDLALKEGLEKYFEKHPELEVDLIHAKENTFEIAKAEEIYINDVAYWRKFNALHGWMAELYEKKGGEDPDFNCNTVRLMSEDLDNLELGLDSLQPVEGFFFGPTDSVDEDDKESVKVFIAKARELIKDGYAVYYDSWW